MIRVLVTGIGAPGIPGVLWCLRNNPDGEPVRVVGVDMDAEASGRLLVEKFYQVPPPGDASYGSKVHEICVREGVDVVLPETTPEALYWSSWKREALPAPVCVSPQPGIGIAVDKFELATFFKWLDLPTGRFHRVFGPRDLSMAASNLGYPGKRFVVKPLDVAANRIDGGRGVRIVSHDPSKDFLQKGAVPTVTLEQLIQELGREFSRPLMVMEYLPGPEYSVDCFRGQKMAMAVPRLRRKVVNGISFDAQLVRDEALIDESLKAAEELNLRYAFGFQFKRDEDGIAKILECNPRGQGTMVASAIAGANMRWMAVQEALGKGPGSAPTVDWGLRFQRTWGGIARTGDRVVEI